MATKIVSIICFVLVLSFQSLCENYLISDPSFAYRGYLPSGWIKIVENDSTQKMFDSSANGNFSAVCYITKYSLDGETPQDWTRSFFIAQKMLYDFSAYYFSSIMYYDSSSNAKHQSSWAPEIYTRCYSSDTFDLAWDEYVYYTAINGYGYEFFVIGDTAEMDKNVDLYRDFLHGLILSNGSSKSSNYLLSDLRIIPQIQLSPSFSPSFGYYISTVGIGIDKISFTPVADDINASIKIQNKAINSGINSENFVLNIGENIFEIQVTAQDQLSTKTYTLEITRLPNEISVKHFTNRQLQPVRNAGDFYDLTGKKFKSIHMNKSKMIAPGLYINQSLSNQNKKKLIIR